MTTGKNKIKSKIFYDHNAFTNAQIVLHFFSNSLMPYFPTNFWLTNLRGGREKPIKLELIQVKNGVREKTFVGIENYVPCFFIAFMK